MSYFHQIGYSSSVVYYRVESRFRSSGATFFHSYLNTHPLSTRETWHPLIEHVIFVLSIQPYAQVARLREQVYFRIMLGLSLVLPLIHLYLGFPRRSYPCSVDNDADYSEESHWCDFNAALMRPRKVRRSLMIRICRAQEQLKIDSPSVPNFMSIP